MEVIVPVPASDFNFTSTSSSPYGSTPSSPMRFGESSCYFSAPNSPSSSSQIYTQFDSIDKFKEEPKSTKPEDDDENEEDFQFDFSGQLERSSLITADELFEKGKIRTQIAKSKEKEATEVKQERGREKRSVYSSNNTSRRGARSVSPLRVSDFGFDGLNQTEQKASLATKLYPSEYANLKCSRKWKLKDLLLFRSVSEGRGTKRVEDVKNSSFRYITDGSRSVPGGSNRGRRGPVSAHELHYTKNRAVSEEMRRKTFLPYKQGLFGCLGFNPALNGLAKGFRSITHGGS